MTHIIYKDQIPGGRHWSMVIKKGMSLRLTDLDGGANVGMLFYNPQMTMERINLPDSLKCQHTFKLTKGHCIYSDMGRIFCSITDDTFGWHDAASGTCNKHLVERKWGKNTYQQSLNDCYRNGYDSFLIQMAKYDLSAQDIAGNINFFSKVVTDEVGNMSLDTSDNGAGKSVDLRFEMDTLVIFHTCPHPLSKAESYPVKPVEIALYQSEPVKADDYCMNACEENKRGFKNNALYQLGTGDIDLSIFEGSLYSEISSATTNTTGETA